VVLQSVLVHGLVAEENTGSALGDCRVKTLSIGIPTYKRSALLKACVDSAVVAAEGRPLEILVVDDSMDDTNAGVMRDLTHAHSFVRWVRNDENLGIDRNIQRAVDLARTDFVWLIGEDDRFDAGSIARIFDRLQDLSTPFLFANYRFVDAAHTRTLSIAVQELADGEQPAATFVRDFLPAVGFIGACIIHRDSWSRTDPAPYDGTYYTHVGRIAEMVCRSGVLAVAMQPCVANRAAGAETFTWKKDSFGVFLGFDRMCSTAAQRCPALADALAAAATANRRRSGFLSIKTSVRLRSEGALDLRQFRTHIAPSAIPLTRKAWLLGLALVPRAVLVPFAALYRFVFVRRLAS
jgi:glycosyltransferase involved in cell wall biosynthesis